MIRAALSVILSTAVSIYGCGCFVNADAALPRERATRARIDDTQPGGGLPESLLAGLAAEGACPIVIVGGLSQSLGAGSCNPTDGGECTAQTTTSNGIDLRLDQTNTSLLPAAEGALGGWADSEKPAAATLQQWRLMREGEVTGELLPMIATTPAVGGSNVASWLCNSDAGVLADAGSNCHEAFYAQIYIIERILRTADAGSYPCTHGVVVLITQEHHGNSDQSQSIAAGLYAQQMAQVQEGAYLTIRAAQDDAGAPMQTVRPRWLVKQIATWNSGTHTEPNVPYQQQQVQEADDGGTRVVSQAYTAIYERLTVNALHMQSPGYQRSGAVGGRAAFRWLELGRDPGIWPSSATVDGVTPTIVHVPMSVPVPPLVLDTTICDNTHVSANYGLEIFQNEVYPPTVTGVAVNANGTQLDVTLSHAPQNWGSLRLRNAWTGTANIVGPYTEPYACNFNGFIHSNIRDSDTEPLIGGSVNTYNWSPTFQIPITGGQAAGTGFQTRQVTFGDSAESISRADDASLEPGAAASWVFWTRRNTTANNTRVFFRTLGIEMTYFQNVTPQYGFTAYLSNGSTQRVHTSSWQNVPALGDTGGWHSIVVRYDGATTNRIHLFVDCVQQTVTTQSGTWQATIPDNANSWHWNHTTASALQTTSGMAFFPGVFLTDAQVQYACRQSRSQSDYSGQGFAPTSHIYPDSDDTTGAGGVTDYGTLGGAWTANNMEAGDFAAGGPP